MSKAFATSTALSTPFSPNSGIDAKNVQEAIEKLSFLMYASSLAGAVFADNGDVTIKIGVSDTSLILPSSVGRWKVSVNDLGDIISDKLDDSDTSLITYWRFKREDGSSVALEVTNDGEVVMVNPPEYVGINIKNFYLKSPSKYLFLLGVAVDGEFYTEQVSHLPNPKFKVISQDDQVLFSTVEHRDLALNYMPIYAANELPARPVEMGNVVPMAFVKNGSLKKPIYHDGASWRYLNTDMPVADATLLSAQNQQYQAVLVPSPVGFWELSATETGKITTSRYTSIDPNSPAPPPIFIANAVGIWYVSANESGTLMAQLVSGTYQPSQIQLMSLNDSWEIIVDNLGELTLRKI